MQKHYLISLIITTPHFRMFLKRFNSLLIGFYPLPLPLFTITNYTFQKGKLLKRIFWQVAKQKVFSAVMWTEKLKKHIEHISKHKKWNSRNMQGRPNFIDLCSPQKIITFPYNLIYDWHLETKFPDLHNAISF